MRIPNYDIKTENSNFKRFLPYMHISDSLESTDSSDQDYFRDSS